MFLSSIMFRIEYKFKSTETPLDTTWVERKNGFWQKPGDAAGFDSFFQRSCISGAVNWSLSW